MARDKSKDDKLFNCSQEHEHRYVFNLYEGNEKIVKDFLEEKCDDKTIIYFNHIDVYQLIQDELELQIPV